MPKDTIYIRGAREHNLKNIDISIPRDKLVVFTGLSGSGKSSLAFDTIYAEGQRRYVESLSSYARQFLGQLDKPDIDYIEGLSPAISIDQKTTSHNPRSTVGTVTEIYDYFRLLFARTGIMHCPKCGKTIASQSIDEIVDAIMALGEGTKLQILAPIVREKKGTHQKVFENAKKNGFVRVRINGEIHDLYEDISLEKNNRHTIEIVVDRIAVKEGIISRITDSVQTALEIGGGIAIVVLTDGTELVYNQNFACRDCGISMEEMTPRSFSFNSPIGACKECLGLGMLMEIDPDLVVADTSKSVFDGGIDVCGFKNIGDDGSYSRLWIEALGQKHGFNPNKAIEDLTDEEYNLIMYGSDEPLTIVYMGERKTRPFEGIINTLKRRYKDSFSSFMKAEIESLMSSNPCPSCKGRRLRDEILAVTIGDKNIAEVCEMSIRDTKAFFDSLTFTDTEMIIAKQILKEINSRLQFLIDVGLDYLTLSRNAGSLSGGEAQRIRLATQIGSSLMGVLYILDEPSIGLHQRDNDKLLATLKKLRDLGNTLIVVEHDEDTMRAADHIVDIGPGAGIHGGYVVAEGTVEDIENCEESITGAYLSGRKKIEVPAERRKGNGKAVSIKGASENNLKNIDVDFPLGKFICVTGVSGSGKSSLVNEILNKSLSAKLNRARKKAGKHKSIKGVENLDKVISIDQSPIGRTPRSNPATYTGVFGDIRTVFSQTNEAKLRGYQPGRFSFNVAGGRCEACQGDGIIKIEMHFLSDVYVPCEVCKGKRYNRETLEVKFKGKNISDVLDMTVEEGLSFFENIPKIRRKLQTLYDVGLGYIKIGQPSTQLSGGEAQRVKLATELSRKSTGRTLYILDEPTTGLHTADVHKLIEVLSILADSGNTVVVIEHNLDVIKIADHIIDLGPEGGDKGGTLVCTGTPEEVAECEASYTGRYLKKILR